MQLSGMSHLLLLGFTIVFILEGLQDSQSDCKDDEDDDVNGWIVLGFAIGGLVFDVIALLSYKYFGTTNDDSSYTTLSGVEAASDAGKLHDVSLHSGNNETSGIPVPSSGGEVDSMELGKHDSLTCGINTNMCAALLHVLSDLMRSTTTMVEGIILIVCTNLCGQKVDGISTLCVCSIIVIGATAATVTWLREVWVYISTEKEKVANPEKEKIANPGEANPIHRRPEM